MKVHRSKDGLFRECKAKKFCPLESFSLIENKEDLKSLNETLTEVKRNFLREKEMTEEEVVDRGRKLDELLGSGKLDFFDSEKRFYDKEIESWGEEREIIHKVIIDNFLEKFKDIPENKELIFSGGISGAGKSTVLKDKIDLNNFAKIDSDDIKEEMFKEGLFDKIEGLTPAETVSFYHEESSYLTKIIYSKLLGKNKNIVLDFTCSSKSSFLKNFKKAKSYGYENISLYFVSVNMKTSKERVFKRYFYGLNDFYNKKNSFGGRFISSKVLEKQKGTILETKNEEVFESLKETFKDISFKKFKND